MNECKKVLEEASTYMEGTIGIETRVQAAYYRAWAAYYKLKGPVRFDTTAAAAAVPAPHPALGPPLSPATAPVIRRTSSTATPSCCSRTCR